MDRQIEAAESVSMAFMLMLEALSPVERAVFLLREVFEYTYEEVGQIVEKSEENCRQIFALAKRHIDAGRRRFEASPEKRDEIARQFFAASERGDLDGLVRLLAADAAFYGGRRRQGGRVPASGEGSGPRGATAGGAFAKFDTIGIRFVRAFGERPAGREVRRRERPGGRGVSPKPPTARSSACGPS